MIATGIVTIAVICNPLPRYILFSVLMSPWVCREGSSSPEEGHLLTESARDVIFYSSHPLHFYTNPTRGVCAWLILSPCLRELRGYRGDYEVKNRCWSHVPREWSGVPPRPPPGGSPLTGTILTPSQIHPFFSFNVPLGQKMMLHMIIYYHCNSDNALLLSFLLHVTCHPYIPLSSHVYLSHQFFCIRRTALASLVMSCATKMTMPSRRTRGPAMVFHSDFHGGKSRIVVSILIM